MLRAVAKRQDRFYVSASIRPVYEHHSNDDAGYHPTGSDSISKGNSVSPSVGDKSLCHAAYSSMAAFETHFKKVSKRRRYAECGCQHKAAK
jgi:hypothetical protein